MASSFLMFLDDTQQRTAVGRTTLDECSACRRALYQTTHNTHNRQTSMPPPGFEPAISADERPHALATGTDLLPRLLRSDLIFTLTASLRIFRQFLQQLLLPWLLNLQILLWLSWLRERTGSVSLCRYFLSCLLHTTTRSGSLLSQTCRLSRNYCVRQFNIHT